MNGTNVIASASLDNPGPTGTSSLPAITIATARSDILWQNSNGEIAIWGMNGSSVIGSASLANPGPTWHV